MANTYERKRPFKEIQQGYKQAAKELCYISVMPDILERIDACTTEDEITRVMTTARHKLFND